MSVFELRSLLRAFRRSLLPFVLLVAGSASQVRAQALLSIPEINASRNKHLGVTIRLEGRVMLYGKDEIRLRNSNIIFRTSSPLQNVPRSQNIELTGRMSLENGRYVFLVSDLAERPSDLEAFQSQRRLIRDNTAGAWYQLGEWAQARGRFYNDAALLEKAESAYLRGVEIERERAIDDRPRKLLSLAERSQRLEIPETVRRSLIHEACHLLWKQSAKRPTTELEPLAATLNKELSGCLNPDKADHRDLFEKYRLDPLGVYDKATAEEQNALHRHLYVDVVRRSLESQLAADGSNGFEVAELIDQRIPERHDLGESFRDRALAKRKVEVLTRTRSEVEKLAAAYRERNQPEQAQQVLDSWLTLQQRKLQPDDIEATLILADDFRALGKRPDTADRLLLVAVQRHPEAPELQERLRKAGYQLREGVWMSQTDAAKLPEDRRVRALREGRVEPGMTGAMVRSSLGEPRQMNRLATSGLISEIWIYGQAGASRLTIQLSRRPLQPDLRVVEVNQTATP